MRGTLSLLVLSLASLLALPRGAVAPPAAGTALRMGLEEVVERADLVVEAHVVSAVPVQATDGLVHTEVQVLVDRTFLGADAGVRTFRLPGGVLPSGRGTLVPGVPTLAAGEDVFLVLSEESSLGIRLPVGLTQGLYRILRTASGAKLVARGGAGVGFVNAVTGELSPRGASELADYAGFVARLESAAAAARARGGDPAGEEGR